ncbi:MAG: hypothetical protein IKS98_03695 [Lachnospiraceae bacterium]|nr:hypothetical protein [Lachnospiraceae bacterium]
MKRFKFMKKVGVMLVLCMVVFSLCACSKDEEEGSSSRRRRDTEEGTEITDGPDVTGPEITSPEPTQIPTEEPTIVPTDYPSPTPTIPATPEVTPEPTPGAPAGPEVSELPDMQKVFDTYYDYVRSQMDDEYTLFETMRFGLAFIDNDDLPELLISEADYHASGTRVIFYNNGEPKEVGQFGEYGGFAYVKKENKIISHYMGMGITTIDTYYIDPEYNAVAVDSLYAEETEDTNLYKVNDVEVASYDDFDAAILKATDPEFGGAKLYVDYNDMLPYYPYVCDEELKDAFTQMYEQLQDDYYVSFSGYFNEKMKTLEGTWILERGSVDTRKEYLSYSIDRDADWNDGAEILSEAVINSDGATIYFTAYKNDEIIDCDLIDLNMYGMKEIYYNNGISEGLDYGWSVEAVPSVYTDWSIFMCTDEEDKLRVVIFRYPDDGEMYEDGYPIGEFIELTYVKAFETEGCSTVSAFLERSEEDDKDGMKAFKAQEYIFINPDTPEDIKLEYGYPADYDEYDLERSHKEPYIIYVDENTQYTLLDRVNIMLDRKAAYEEFESVAEYGAFCIYFETKAGAEDYTGAVAVAIQEDYIG